MIDAHTVQKKRVLATIARKNHVFGFTRSLLDHLDRKLVIEWGVQEASTRPFLCGSHDNTVFSPMEKLGLRLCREHCFLLAYRALLSCIYLVKAEEQVAALIAKEASRFDAARQDVILRKSYATKSQAVFRLRQLEREKQIYDHALLSSDLSRFRFFVIELEQCPEIVSSALFFPVRDFEGNQLQPMIPGQQLQAMTFSLVPIESSGVAVFVWSDESNEASSRLIASIEHLRPEQLPHALVRLCFEHCQNSYFSPSWWETLSDDQRGALETRFVRAVGVTEIPEPKRLADDGLRVVNWKIVSRRWL